MLWVLQKRLFRLAFGSHSEWMKIKSGVPQGSVLGTLLFLIYINDVVDSLCANLLEFADDTEVFSVVSTTNDIDRLQILLKGFKGELQN